jgi:hypothetical protein
MRSEAESMGEVNHSELNSTLVTLLSLGQSAYWEGSVARETPRVLIAGALEFRLN